MAIRMTDSEVSRMHRSLAVSKLALSRPFGIGGSWWTAGQWQGNGESEPRTFVELGAFIAYVVVSQVRSLDKDVTAGYQAPREYSLYAPFDRTTAELIEGPLRVPQGYTLWWPPRLQALQAELPGLQIHSLTDPKWQFELLDIVPRGAYFDAIILRR